MRLRSAVASQSIALALLVTPAPAAERPNIVLIMSDDMGFSDLGCYGGEIRTPNLDRLASGGLRFSQFYNCGRCCPTRASLLTGLYPHQAGVGHMTSDYGLPGYAGNLNTRCLTIAEAVKPAGYATYMCGKWHVTRFAGPEGPKDTWPLQRGFDRFYGTIQGAGSFWDPTTLCRGNRYITPENDPEYRPESFYYTDAISDNAVRFIGEHLRSKPGTPFFAYVAYTAAHWPMHARPVDIAKYKGQYDAGYTAVREGRLARLRELGLLPEGWQPTPQAGDWESVAHKDWESALMEVYAAMVDNMDQGIGRIVAELADHRALDNTLILFLQDNGGCAEPMGRESNAAKVVEARFQPLGKDGLQTQIWPPMQTRDGRPVRTGPGVMPGPADVYHAYGRDWANVSNTPFREYKHWVHEGGIATPLIAHWPKGIAKPNRWIHEPAHLIDIMATALDLSGAVYPADKIAPEGSSLRPAFGGGAVRRAAPIFWEHEGNRAMRDGKWKLVAKGAAGPWELYDMEADRTEMHDLAREQPERLARMAASWKEWAGRVGVVPFGSWNKKAKAPRSAGSK